MASKVMWITRDDEAVDVEIWPYKAHPYKDEDGEFDSDTYSSVEYLCYGSFHKITGITLKPGEKKKYRLVEV